MAKLQCRTEFLEHYTYSKVSWKPSLSLGRKSGRKSHAQIHSYDLPSDVFGPGETKPSRPKKRSAKKSEPIGAKRRLEFSGVEVCVSIGPFEREAASKA